MQGIEIMGRTVPSYELLLKEKEGSENLEINWTNVKEKHLMK